LKSIRIQLKITPCFLLEAQYYGGALIAVMFLIAGPKTTIQEIMARQVGSAGIVYICLMRVVSLIDPSMLVKDGFGNESLVRVAELADVIPQEAIELA